MFRRFGWMITVALLAVGLWPSTHALAAEPVEALEISDSQWAVVVDRDVELQLRNGKTLRGRVLRIGANSVVFVDSKGELLGVSRLDVRTIHLVSTSPAPAAKSDDDNISNEEFYRRQEENEPLPAADFDPVVDGVIVGTGTAIGAFGALLPATAIIATSMMLDVPFAAVLALPVFVLSTGLGTGIAWMFTDVGCLGGTLTLLPTLFLSSLVLVSAGVTGTIIGFTLEEPIVASVAGASTALAGLTSVALFAGSITTMFGALQGPEQKPAPAKKRATGQFSGQRSIAHASSNNHGSQTAMAF